MYGLGTQPLNGVANVGTRPTVDGSYQVLEVHLFGFERDIYGAHLTVEFVNRIRDERRFASFEALRAQIARDAAAARGMLTI